MKMLIVLAIYLFSLSAYGNSLPEYSIKYDPNRDVSVDFNNALKKASKENKLLLMEFGGDWCVWCHRLDAFIEKNDEIKKRLSEVFVLLKVNVSEENSNEQFLARLPKIKGYPHFMIANDQGKIIATKNTAKLESGKSYSKKAFLKFIKTWEKSNK